jgi:ankyrin repeat protein
MSNSKNNLYLFVQNMLLTKTLCRDVLEKIIDTYIIDNITLEDACLNNWFYSIDLLILTGHKINIYHMLIVCEKGYFDLVKFFNENWGYISDDYCMDDNINNPIDIACAYGHLDIVKYLVENRRKHIRFNKWRCSTSAIDYACEGGHLEIIKYLYSKNVHGTNDAFNNNHTHILDWLNENMLKYYNFYINRNFYF